MSTLFLFRCLRHKCFRQRRSILLILMGLIIAAAGVLFVASIARNRELKTPWYGQRSAEIHFSEAVSANSVYEVLSKAYQQGTLNGYALIADFDPVGGICLGGLEGNLWQAVSGEDAVYSTDDDVFWIHQQSVPTKYLYDLENLTAQINGITLFCKGLTYRGLNWDLWDDASDSLVDFLLDGDTPTISEPMYSQALDEEGSWIYISPVIVTAAWMAKNDIPIVGVCLTLVAPNDAETLLDISENLTSRNTVVTDWDGTKVGALTANEWVYLGALILALFSAGSLFYGLIDGFHREFYVVYKVGIPRMAIYFAVSFIVFILCVPAFVLATTVYLLFLHYGATWLAPLPGGYIGALFLLFVSVWMILTIIHTRCLLRTFRKKGIYL